MILSNYSNSKFSINPDFAIGMQNPPQELTLQIVKQFVGQG
jgi:hypothetical protein